MSTSERITFTQEQIRWTEGEVRRLRGELDYALGVVKADVKTAQNALAVTLQGELKILEAQRSADLARLQSSAAAKLGELDKAEAARKSRVGNVIKQAALKLRDVGKTLAPHQPVIAFDSMDSEHIVPTTEVREFVTVGTLKLPNASTLDRDLPRVPALVPFVDRGHLIIESPSGTSDDPDAGFKALLASLVAQTYASAPAGQMVITVFNPRSSKVLAGYRPTGAETAGLLKVLQPTRDAFEKALDEQLSFIQRAESSIGTYSSLGELVRRTGQHEHQYHTLVIIDGPGDWSTKSVELLEKLLAAGGKAGLSVLLHRDPATPAPDRIDVERLYQYASVLKRTGSQWALSVKGVTSRAVPVDPVAPVSDTAQAAIMRLVVEGAESGSLPSIPFSDLVERIDGTSESGIKISMGRKGTQITELVLGDTVSNIQNILVGGRAGSGKTNLLKVMIYSMAARYARDELELFLLDFKEGGDFMPFVGGSGHLPLPNATVVSRDCDPDFGLATLRYFEKEMNRRSNLTSDSGVSNIWDLRARTGIKVPRWVLVIDEFQGLFAGPAYVEATELLENLVRKGRSFGLHVVLATQTLSGVKFAGDKDKAIFENISGRVVLQLGPGEFTKFMESGNDEGDQLRYRGQAIFNPMGGRKSENQMFVVARADADETTKLQDELYLKQAPDGARLPAPFVYRGGETVSAAQLLEKNGGPVERDGNLPVWFGQRNTINPPVASAMLAPIAGSNVLVLGGDDKTMPSAIATVQTAVLSAVAASTEPIVVLVFEQLIPQFRSGALIDDWLDTLAALGARVVCYDAATAQEFVQAVQEATEARQRTVVALLGAENSDFGRFADEGNLWRSLIRDMPRKNVNLIGHWSDIRDIPGDKNALKDDYKTMLFLGKNEQLVIDATKRSRFDLPPLHNSRTVVFAAAASQDGIVAVASVKSLDAADLKAFRALATKPAGSVVRGGVPVSVAAPTPNSDTAVTASPTVPAGLETPAVAMADVIVRAEHLTASGASAVLGQGARGAVSVTFGGQGVRHLLVAGGGLTGKSVVTATLLYSLAARHPASELRIDLIDSIEDGDFPDLNPGALPHLGTVTATLDVREIGSILGLYTDEAQRRQAIFSAAGASSFEDYRARGEHMPRWILVWNEYPEALTPILAAQVEWLAGYGAQSGLHLVLTALTPFGGDDLPIFTRTSGRLLTRVSEEDSIALVGSSDAALLGRRKQALFAAGVSEAASILSIPENSDEYLAELRSSLGGEA